MRCLRHSYNCCAHSRCSVRVRSVMPVYWLICDSNLQRVEFSPRTASPNKWMLMKISSFSLVCARAVMNSYYVFLWAWSRFNRQSLGNHMLTSSSKKKHRGRMKNERRDQCRDISDRPTCKKCTERQETGASVSSYQLFGFIFLLFISKGVIWCIFMFFVFFNVLCSCLCMYKIC